MADPILWHKLESDGNSEVGNNPTDVGSPVFTTGSVKFGKGLETPTASAGLSFGTVLSQAQINDKWSMSFFWKPHFASTDTTAYTIATIDDGAGYAFAHIIYNQSVGSFLCWIASDGGSTGRLFLFTPPASWSADDVIHLAMVCDNTQLNSSGIKLYMDKVECTYAGVYAGNDSTAWTFTVDIGYRISGWFFGAYNSAIDNPKIYNYAIGSTEIDWDYANEGLMVTLTNGHYIINF